MAQIEGLTLEDGSIWFVKWIDRFGPALGTTRSPYVTVLLQKLDIRTLKLVWDLKPTQIRNILKAEVTPSRFRSVKILAGWLPALRIGDVVQDNEVRGQLYQQVFHAHLPEEFRGEPLPLNAAITKPETWRAPVHRVLNVQEWTYPYDEYKRAKAIVIEHLDMTVVIPASVIFTCFFGQTPDLANCFLSGPWDLQMEQLICFDNLASGLETKLDPSSCWNIVVQNGVPPGFIPYLAYYYFHPYGRMVTNRIFSSFQQSRGNQDDAWYIDARIPFLQKAHLFKCRGFNISLAGGHRKFLVTDILEFPFPHGIEIAREWKFSSRRGHEVIPVEEPFRFIPAIRRDADARTSMTSGADALPNSDIRQIYRANMVLLNPPPERFLEKAESKSFLGGGAPVPSVGETNPVSAGLESTIEPSVSKGDVATYKAASERSFDQILSALKSLEADGRISNVKPVPAADSLRQATVGDLPVWLFRPDGLNMPLLSKAAMAFCQYRRRGRARDGTPYRPALIVQFQFEETWVYWIEIGTRTQQYWSAIVWDCGDLEVEVLTEALDVVALDAGRKFARKLDSHLRAKYGARAAVIGHVFDETHRQLDTERLYRAIRRHVGSCRA